MTIGVWVDDEDNVWIIHRGAATLNDNERALDLKTGECCTAAPPVLVFDRAGNLVRSWGGPGQGYEWPQSNHGIHVDYKGNVWIGGNGDKDSHLLKFTKDGKFLMQVGKMGTLKGSNDAENFGRVAKIWVDPKTNEAYIADGYRNKARRRARRGYRQDEAILGRLRQQARRRRPRQVRSGRAAAEAVPQSRALRGAQRRRLGLRVRSPGRPHPGLQARRHVRQGSVVREEHARLGLDMGHRLLEGSRSSASFSWRTAPTRRCASWCARRCRRSRIWRRRAAAGQFFGVHSIATDSKGNIYTTETYEGKRVQKFVYKGMGPVPAGDQGVPWPRS
jgi:hypothetical protein